MIPIPENLLDDLGPEMKMDVHWVDVKLSSGARFNNLVVRGGRYLTGRAEDPNGVGDLPFSSQDIVAVRRRGAFPWPAWPLWLFVLFCAALTGLIVLAAY